METFKAIMRLGLFSAKTFALALGVAGAAIAITVIAGDPNKQSKQALEIAPLVLPAVAGAAFYYTNRKKGATNQ